MAGPLAAQLHPRAILLGNLFRDQLDRYGELETIAERWAQTLRGIGEPAAGAERRRPADRRPRPGEQPRRPVLYFGIEDDSLALAGMAHAADAKHCRRCGAPYVFDAIYLGHLGHYHCPSCGQSQARAGVTASDVRLEGVRAARFTLRTPGGRGARSRSRCPASTTSTTRSPPPRSRRALEVAARRRSSRACRARAPRSAAPRR